MVDLTGDIAITAQNLNVQLSHAGANPDSVRIGNGTDTAEVNASGELTVNDADANAALLLIAADADTLAQSVATAGAAAKTTGAQLMGSDGTNARAVLTDINGRLSVDVNSSALPSGAATSANQTTANGILTTIDTDTGNIATSTGSIDSKLANDFGSSAGAVRTAAQVGNAGGAADFAAGNASAQTLRVVVATDQSPIPASQSGTWNINNVSGTVSLPTGASTLAEQQEQTANIGDVTDAAVTNPASSASVIAALKGLLSYQADYPILDTTQTQTVDATVGGITFTAPAGARHMIIQNSLEAGGAVRFRASAETPTASSGFYLGVGQSTSLMPAGTFKAIRTGGSNEDGNVTVIWFT